MQTILGSGGAAGTEIAKQLINYTKDIKLVSRNPRKVNQTDQLFAADISNPVLLDKAIDGSEVVYVTVSFEYNAEVWRQKWPMFMGSLIELSKKHNSKIVFIDNMYMYDTNYISNMTEETPINPSSKKGKVRAQIFDMLMNAVNNNEIKALVARGADFYGPNVDASFLTQTVLNNLLKNKNPQWLGKLDVLHNFTYSVDIGKAAALLGNTPDAYNQVWHLPTYEGKLTSREWIELLMSAFGQKKKIQAIPVWAMGALGLFVPIIKELKDTSYQLDRDYHFNSSKFNRRFNFTPTTPETGMGEIIKAL